MRDTLTASLINLPINSFENAQVTAIEIMIGCCITVICYIYNPPGCVPANIAKLCDVINYLCNKYINISILDDLNLPV